MDTPPQSRKGQPPFGPLRLWASGQAKLAGWFLMLPLATGK